MHEGVKGMKLEVANRGANHDRPVGHREDFAFTLNKIRSHWRATYVSSLAPMLRIDVGAWGKSRRTSEETTQE